MIVIFLVSEEFLAQRYPGCEIGQASNDVEAIKSLQGILIPGTFGEALIFLPKHSREIAKIR
jgi:hypothetical protein